MNDETKIRILEERVRGFELWLKHKITICIANPEGKLSPLDCYDDALAVFKLTFNREAGK